ncbi:MAG: PKD domain-containing protein [Opitutaceae bacterium]|jgi:hypothetical protein|nr:PKD domain-containing protein [Opitutaceae bacterium]
MRTRLPLFATLIITLILSALQPFSPSALSLERPEVTFPIFQFPQDKIPRIDGDTSDWDIVPESYVIGTDQLVDTTRKNPAPDPGTLDVRVRVGWVKGLNRLYFLYEASDNYWDFASPGLHNDTFELVVDGDASGGPLTVPAQSASIWTPDAVGERRVKPDPRIAAEDFYWNTAGAHAQNYHIFTPAAGKDWAMVMGPAASWIKRFPRANAAYRHDLKPGQPGKLTLEFYITPYDYAAPEGPARSAETVLRENKIIGLGWIIIDYDDVAKTSNAGFWVLSHRRTMFGNASDLCAFRLMPPEPAQRPAALTARWSFSVVDMDRRLVAFKDETAGPAPPVKWHWDFGDGATSAEQHPQHAYEKPGNYTVLLEAETAAGEKSRFSRVWDVQLR